MTRNTDATETQPKRGRDGSKMPPDAATAAAADEPEDNGGMSAFIAEDEGAAETMIDEFDSLESFALPQNFDPGVEEEDPPVSCRRPGPFDFFRVHPDPAMSVNVGILELRDERDDPYLVKPNIYAAFGNQVSRRRLFVCKTMQGTLFLWAVKLNEDGRRSGGGKYNETALKAAERAKTKWTRIASDQELKCYRIFGPGQEFPDPVWPKTTLLDLMRKAFGDGYLVKDANHPLVRRIRGLAK
jgi:hypothetical protein